MVGGDGLEYIAEADALAAEMRENEAADARRIAKAEQDYKDAHKNK